jgi:hypothetical protein
MIAAIRPNELLFPAPLEMHTFVGQVELSRPMNPFDPSDLMHQDDSVIDSLCEDL